VRSRTETACVTQVVNHVANGFLRYSAHSVFFVRAFSLKRKIAHSCAGARPIDILLDFLRR
jgi:hypothetical protein